MRYVTARAPTGTFLIHGTLASITSSASVIAGSFLFRRTLTKQKLETTERKESPNDTRTLAELCINRIIVLGNNTHLGPLRQQKEPLVIDYWKVAGYILIFLTGIFVGLFIGRA